MQVSFKKKIYHSLKENSTILFIALITLIPITVITIFNSFSLLLLFIIIFISVIILFVFNFDIIFAFFLITIFIDGYLYSYAISEIFSTILIFIFFVTHKISWNDLKNPFLFGFLILLISIIPSLINSDIPFLSTFLSLRLSLFFILMLLLTNYFMDRSRYEYFVITFLGISLINAIILIGDALKSGSRSFGFAGIMYVDIVGISIVLSLTFLLYHKRNKFIYFILFFVFTIALLLTQTRNAWVSSGIIIFGIWFQYMLRLKKESMDYIKAILISIIIGGLLALAVLKINQSDSSVLERVNISSLSNNKDVDGYIKTAGSLVSRVFIWETALNAFIAHPITGIGLYTFPVLSGNYFTISPNLFQLYVANLSPHETFIAILCEAGILGFIGLVFFLSITIYKTWHVMKDAKNEIDKFYSTLMFWLIAYIFISMLMTDAWLWGRLFMLWCVILSMSAANIKSTLKT